MSEMVLTDVLSGDLAKPARRLPANRPAAFRVISKAFRWTSWLLLAPWRLFCAVRYGMTTASVSVLLTGIMTLNIIWGYPWTGMFAACISLMSVGLLANYWMRPRLRIDFSLPAFTPAGQLCRFVTHAINDRRVPAFDFSVGLCASTDVRRRRRAGKECGQSVEASPPVSFQIARPGDRIDVSFFVIFHRRGIHRIPDVLVTTSFPFHLFHSGQVIESRTTIAVTPRPLTGDEDAAASCMLHAIGNWSHRLLSGDALDYTGSREYQPGMPVRRWDFPSWARLGRPIVREYQSPSVPAVLLLVDTAIPQDRGVEAGLGLLERALSLAATALNDFVGKSIRVQLYVTSELPSQQPDPAKARVSMADGESMQIRLAGAEAIDAATADDRLGQFIRESSRGPALLITSRRHSAAIEDLRGSVEVVCVDQAEQNGDGQESFQSLRNRTPKTRWDAAHDVPGHQPAGGPAPKVARESER